MGYSNNKWRKILTILMIINLCFVIFAKITTVFGAFSQITYKDVTYTVSDNLNNYYLICLISYDGDFYHYDRVISDEPATITKIYNYGYRLKFVDNTKWSRSTSNSQSVQKNFFNSPNATTGDRTSFQTDIGASNYTQDVQVWANYNVKNSSGDIVISETSDFINPYFDNLTEIENGYPDGVFISRGDYSEDEPLYFHLLKITNTVADVNQSTYYYDSKIFKLTKDSKYYKTYDDDTDNKYSYYSIERSSLTLDTNSSYLYVLSNSGNSISNSYGILQPDIPGGIYDVVESDTAGVITEQQALNDKIANINNNQQDIANSQQEIANNSNNINNYLNENTISNDTNENIDTNLNFNNQNSDLNNLNNGFFTRLTTMLSNISTYNLAEDTVINIPLPNSQKHLELHSNIFYNNVTGALRTIINAFWTFIFTFYLWKFINKIYIAVSSGSILDNFTSSGETITNNML